MFVTGFSYTIRLPMTAEQINASSEEISVTMDEVARGVERQKGSVEKMAALIRDLGQGVEQISRTCRDAAASAKGAEAKSGPGSRTAAQTFEHLSAVFRRLEESSKSFVAFSERIHQIHRVAEVITNLSRQTNLLALNAAIEASKAGEEGKGFAVVASEIRKLADGAERSADQISEMLAKLDEESRGVRRLTEESGRQLTEGRGGLQTAGQALDDASSQISSSGNPVRLATDGARR